MSPRPHPPAGSKPTLLIACGALARDLVALIEAQGWQEQMDLRCLPASLHNRPERIPDRLQRVIRAARGRYPHIAVVYGDCGSGGGIDRVCAEEGVDRIPGPHCYAMFAGQPDFDALMEEEPGSFFLTDYLVRQFEALVIRGLGLDRHPALRDLYFGNYRRVVYLAQSDDAALDAKARAAAERLGLAYEKRWTGPGAFAPFLARLAGQAPSPASPTLLKEPA